MNLEEFIINKTIYSNINKFLNNNEKMKNFYNQIGIEKGLSSEEFSKKLINISKERDTRDNSSCIVVKLNKNI